MSLPDFARRIFKKFHPHLCWLNRFDFLSGHQKLEEGNVTIYFLIVLKTESSGKGVHGNLGRCRPMTSILTRLAGWERLLLLMDRRFISLHSRHFLFKMMINMTSFYFIFFGALVGAANVGRFKRDYSCS